MNAKQKAEFKKKIAASDKRIAGAVEILSGHYRGQRFLRDFRSMMEGGGYGLDDLNLKAFQTLVNEVVEGRRDFISNF